MKGLLQFFNDLFTPIKNDLMSKNSEKMIVYGTKDGKLYIKPFELFSRPKVQNLIERVAASESVKAIQKK